MTATLKTTIIQEPSSATANLTLGTDGGVDFQSGSASAPSISNVSDTNTGVFFPAADTAAITTGGTERMRVDSTGNVLVTGSGGLGYGAGSGGTVTQATSKSTAVTLNKPTGQITMRNSALAAGASVLFQVNNSLCSSTDVALASIGSTGFSGAYLAQVTYCISGAFAVRVTNLSGGSLSEAVVINFTIIKGATS